MDNQSHSDEINNMKIETANIRSLVEVFTFDADLLITIWDGIPALMFCKDDKNTILKANDTLCFYLGLPKSEVEGKKAEELMPAGKDTEKYLSNDLSVLHTGIAKTNIFEELFDTRIKIRTDKFPIKKEGKIIGILGFSIILNT